MSLSEQQSGSSVYRYDADIVDDPAELFSPDKQNQKQLAQGRGSAKLISYKDHSLVIKHYHRGGMVARFNNDSYLWNGKNNTRAFSELSLLQKMYEDGLPVPKPVAARITRNSIFYHCDLVTEELKNTSTLSERLMNSALESTLWESIGACIRTFHDKNIYHADLNASNILLNESKQIFLIDFDKGKFMTSGTGWKQRVLDRLKRSLLKFKDNNQVFHYSNKDWLSLTNGYHDHKAA